MSAEDDGPGGGTPRRTFLQAVGAVVAGGAAWIAPAAAAAATLLDPLRRGARDASVVRVAPLAVLPEGSVRRFRVVSDRTDAWTQYEATPVGAVFLRREGEQVRALSVVCPHAGCSVNLAPDGTHFTCPCHRSRFGLDGVREGGPSPRDLDALDVEVRDGEVWVRYQAFRPGTEAKIPV